MILDNIEDIEKHAVEDCQKEEEFGKYRGDPEWALVSIIGAEETVNLMLSIEINYHTLQNLPLNRVLPDLQTYRKMKLIEKLDELIKQKRTSI